LVPGDTNSRRDIFVRDLNSGDTTRVSVSTTGAQGDASAFIASISGDGRYVAFDTRAALVASDTNNYVDVYLRDRLLNQTLHVSAPLIASSTPGGSNDPDITPDGRYIAYASQDFTVVAADTNAGYDAYVYDVVTGQTTIASVDSSGVQGPSDQHQGVSISDDGRFVAFASDAALVAGDTNNVPDYYVHDQTTGQTVRVSVDSLGAQANAFLWLAPPVISGDGRYVAFASTATNLVSGDINGVTDVFLHDRVFGVTSMVSVNPAGLPSNAQSGRPALSRDARYVLFDSKATDLVAGDINGVDDVFRVDRGASAPQTYCTAGVTFNGCQAQIAASSNPSASAANSCSITVSDVEGQRAGVIFYGIDNSNFTPLPWGTGTSFLCVKSPHQRTGTQNSGGTAGTCSGSFALDWNAFQQSNPSSLGQPWTSGATVYAQAWFRDPPSAKSTHLSNALRLTYLPRRLALTERPLQRNRHLGAHPRHPERGCALSCMGSSADESCGLQASAHSALTHRERAR
jgi:Tol biopolymer transport system component